MKTVHVIGAGFAGLTVSLRLAQKGFKVELHEASDRGGGLLGTDRTEYGISERAANALIRTEKAENLFKELGITPSYPLESSKKRFLFRKSPKQWPLTLVETLKFICRLAPQLIKGKQSLKPQQGQTLQAWGEEHLGKAPTQFILGPAMQGIYGNEISGLSSSLILGALFSGAKKSRYKGLLTGPGGMQDLVNHLEAELKNLGVQIYLNSSAKLEDLNGPVIVATSAQAASHILEKSHLALATILKKVRMSSLMSVTLFFKNAQTDYQGFGCLIPRGSSLKTLGILMNSYIFKDRNKTYNETWILGGITEELLLEKSDTAILQLIQSERATILNKTDEILDYRINRWRQALPYYDLNLEQAQTELQNIEMASGLYLHGNYLSGIGLSKILDRSEELAEKIASKYG